MDDSINLNIEDDNTNLALTKLFSILQVLYSGITALNQALKMSSSTVKDIVVANTIPETNNTENIF